MRQRAREAWPLLQVLHQDWKGGGLAHILWRPRPELLTTEFADNRYVAAEDVNTHTNKQTARWFSFVLTVQDTVLELPPRQMAPRRDSTLLMAAVLLFALLIWHCALHACASRILTTPTVGLHTPKRRRWQTVAR